MILLFLLIPALGFLIVVNTNTVESTIAFFIGILGWLLNVILSPVNALISQTMPDLSNGISAINTMFDYASTYLGYVANASLLPQTAINIIIAFFIFSFGVTFFVWGMKLVIKWYQVFFR